MMRSPLSGLENIMSDKNTVSAFNRPLRPSAHLAAVVGGDPLPRSSAVKKMWEYIKSHGLQDASDKRQINADAVLRPIFGGADRVSMFEMNKHMAGHLSAA